MKKFITILITFTLVFSAFAVTSFASSSSSKITVKKATYLKYKKAYQNQKKLKAKINELEKELALKQMDYEDAMDQCDLALEEAEKLKGQNNWIWMNINSLGIRYDNKTWTVPTTYPEKFMINGVTYKVVKEEE